MCLRRGGRLRGSGRIGSGRPRSCRSHRPRRVPSRGSRGRGPGPGTPCLNPTPGGVDLVMSPGLALCQVGSRGSSADGFRRAGLAWREVGWIPLRWARITQAGPGSSLNVVAIPAGLPPGGSPGAAGDSGQDRLTRLDPGALSTGQREPGEPVDNDPPAGLPPSPGCVPVHCFAGRQGPDRSDRPDYGGSAAHGRGCARGARLPSGRHHLPLLESAESPRIVIVVSTGRPA